MQTDVIMKAKSKPEGCLVSLISYIRQIFQAGIYSRVYTHSRVDHANRITTDKCMNIRLQFLVSSRMGTAKLAEVVRVNRQEEA